MATLTYEGALERIGHALQFGINPSLEAITDLCARLGDPQRQLRVIQVAGTNGKTSVARMCAAILSAHGLKVGHYLSPHLEEYRERIVVDSELIEPDAFAAALAVVLPAADAVGRERGQALTEFELLTAMALRHFADAGCDAAVLEAGLGGRWDATTVCDPEVAVITSIALDHCDRLGPDEASIATEKAEIVKAGGALVLGLVTGEALDVIRRKAESVEVPIQRLDSEIIVEPLGGGIGRIYMSVTTPLTTYADLCLVTDALYQQENAAVAVAAAEWFAGGGAGSAGGSPIERGALGPLVPATVRGALGSLSFPGRMELLSECPTLVLDGAHNPDAARRLVEALRHAFAGRRIYLVLGIMTDKDVAGIVDALVPVACHVVCTKNASPRCLDPVALKEVVRQAGVPAEAIKDLGAACERAIALAGPEGVVVVTGSLYTAGEARTWWRIRDHGLC